MKIICWNTNGLRATVKQGYFLPLFTQFKPDIVCLQETKADAEQLDEETRLVKGYHSYFASSKVKKGYSGVGVYTKEEPINVEYGLGVERFDEQGRTLVLHFRDYVLINCYFPNGGGSPEKLQYKLDFYETFLAFVEKLRKTQKKIIFCGDVNVAHREIDIARPKENINHVGFLPIERAWMDSVIDSGYIDVFRTLFPEKKDAYTYWDTYTRARERNVGWRIDYFFVTPEIMKRVKKCEILVDYYGSDHCPILLELL